MPDTHRAPAGRSPAVALREITEDNRAAVEALAVTEEQSHYVASVTTVPAGCRGLSRREALVPSGVRATTSPSASS